MAKDKLISLDSAKSFMDVNWPNDPLLKQIFLNLLEQLPAVGGEEVQEMFDAVHIETKRTYKVYAVEGTMFLIYLEEPQDCRWEWRDMTEFKPAQDNDRNQINTRRI